MSEEVEKDIRKRGCFLHVVRYDTFFVREALVRTVENIQKYNESQAGFRWRFVKYHADVALKEIANTRRDLIYRNLTVIQDLTNSKPPYHPELLPTSFIPIYIDYSCDLLAGVTKIEDPRFENDMIVKLVSEIQDQIDRLNSVLDSLEKLEPEEKQEEKR